LKADGATNTSEAFADFEFDDRRRSLKARGQPIRLSGQAIELLYLLLERPGALEHESVAATEELP
jgi:DNA-binding winged helix-turn-helix (wHTH) protein